MRNSIGWNLWFREIGLFAEGTHCEGRDFENLFTRAVAVGSGPRYRCNAAMNASAETSPLDTTRKHLRICVIGYADSTHVAARARCFAELGHEVFLLTESPSLDGIPGVTELVPALDPVLARHLLLRIALWLCRKL